MDDVYDEDDDAYHHEEDDGPRHAASPIRSLWDWAVPIGLGVVAIAAAVGALLADRHPEADPVETAAGSATPVLSARRAPEVIAAPVADRRLEAALQGWIGQSPPNSCLVVEAGGRTLFAHNATAPLAGASTQKLVTSAAMLLTMGPDDHLTTSMQAAEAPADGVVRGDLFLVGGGDPMLAAPSFAENEHPTFRPSLYVDPAKLVDAIEKAGITRIEGSVVGDGTRYDDVLYHPAWPDRYRAQGEVAVIDALNINDGWATYAADGRGSGQQLPATDPAANAAAVLTELLRQRGVTVTGEARSGAVPEGAQEVAKLESPPIRQIIAEMLTDSDDTTAEMLLKEIGVREGGAGTWEAGAAAATRLLTESGVTFDGARIVDGSGLSTDDRLTCQLLVELLSRPETGPVLVEGLAIAGETGTLTPRWNGSPVQGRLRAKTGTLNTVTALSGVVDAQQGSSLTFAYVTNVPEPERITSEVLGLQDGLANILITYPQGVDITTLLPQPAPAG